MPHHTPLIATIVFGLVLAFLFGAVANRLRLSPLVGYLLAGVAVGPHTPGFVADQALATQLAEIGVILLMFGVGMHFSVKDLLSVRSVAVPGAVVQIAVSTLLGMGLAWALGWPPGGGFVFGLALSVASTVVLLRALQERHLLDTDRGRIVVGWLIVQDLVMVLALVLLPALAGLLAESRSAAPASLPGASAIAATLALTIGKVAAFVALMLIVGRRVIPWILHYVAHTDRASCSVWRCWRSRSALPTARRRSSRCRSRSAPSSPAWCWRRASSASKRPTSRCRCGMPSPFCSSSRSACCSIR